jgi:phosphoglycerol transferase MdoB-like AlkP superfamily enzyme
MDMLNTAGAALGVIAFLALISLPGVVITFIGWRLSRDLRPLAVRTVFRAGLLATAVTPTIYGHAGPLPAIVLVFLLQGRERFAGIVPILVVWLIAIFVMTIRAKEQGFRLRYLDEVCAWLIFLAGLLQIVLTDFLHTRGILDTSLVWIFAAMLNLIRIGNGYSVRRLKAFCIGANLSAFVLEAVRWKMYEGILSFAFLVLIGIESAFSITAMMPILGTSD